MSYVYLDDIAIADVAFEARGKTREELFIEAGDALMNAMVGDLDTILPQEYRTFHLQAASLERLLFEYLQLFIFYKDSQQQLLRVSELSISEEKGSFTLDADAGGERIDPRRHELDADVKAVTLYRFQIRKDAEGWKATVVLDV